LTKLAGELDQMQNTVLQELEALRSKLGKQSAEDVIKMMKPDNK
jgi:hypothetical protein